MIPLIINRRIEPIRRRHLHPLDVLLNRIEFRINTQALIARRNQLLHRRVRPHLIAQQAVNDNVAVVCVFVEGHGVILNNQQYNSKTDRHIPEVSSGQHLLIL